MRCETYRDALLEAAAASAELEGGAAEHLEACVECGAALEREQKLFGAIDDGLRARVNELPTDGFLAKVRLQISDEVQAPWCWNSGWALAGVVAVWILIAMLAPSVRLRRKPSQATGLHVPAAVGQPAAIVEMGHGLMAKPETRLRTPRTVTRASAPAVAANRGPEVLVPPDEAKAFAQFVTRLSQRDGMAQAVVNPVAVRPEEDSEIPPVEIAGLHLGPLGWEK